MQSGQSRHRTRSDTGGWPKREIPAVTDARPRIRERLAGDGHEAPLVACSMKREDKHAEAVVLSHLAVRRRLAQGREESTARTDHELTDSKRWTAVATGILWRKAFVIVRVPVEHDVSARFVERLPERLPL